MKVRERGALRFLSCLYAVIAVLTSMCSLPHYPHITPTAAQMPFQSSPAAAWYGPCPSSSRVGGAASAVSRGSDTTTATATSVASERFGNSNNNDNVKIAGFTDFDYVLLAVIWYDRLTSLGYAEHVIVAADDETVSYFKGTNYRVEEYVVPRGGGGSNNNDTTTGTDAQRQRHRWARRVYRARVEYCAEQVRRGISVLLTDVDNTFSRYVPLTQFQSSRHDVYHAYGTVFPKSIVEIQGFVVCGGMMWYTANSRTSAFLEHVLKLCGPTDCDDQGVINAALAMTLRMVWDEDDAAVDDEELRRRPPHSKVPGANKTGRRTRVRMEERYGSAARTGRSNVTGHSVKIWSRQFAFRGPVDPSVCPERNWVAMPLDVPKRYKPEKLGTVAEKLKRIALWEKFCGRPTTLLGSPIE